MPETFATQTSTDRPCWTARRLANLLSIHHLTLLKKVQDTRGKFEIPAGAFKLGHGWRWRDEDVQAFLLKVSGAGAQPEPADAPPPQADEPAKRRPGRPRKNAANEMVGAA